MSILDIRPVESGKSKIVLGFAGGTGSGKTLTALLVARGMVDDSSEIGFLDAENKRGSLYAKSLDGKFFIGDLYPPFSPSRYSQAIQEFQNSLKGIKVLIIDSITHEWEGTGGCEDIANAPKADGSPRAMPNWIVAKREHKAFMNVLLQSDMHIICCIRARDKTDFKIPTKPVSLGVQPICEKNFMFEMTASVMMEDNGKKQIHTKVPDYLKEAFGDGKGYLGIETGQKIRAWLEEGTKPDLKIERIKSEALFACEKGVDALMKVWESLTTEEKNNKELYKHFGVCKSSAKEYDRINSDSEDNNEWVNEIKVLLTSCLNVLEKDEIEYIESVLSKKQTSMYKKAKQFLTSKLSEKENENTN